MQRQISTWRKETETESDIGKLNRKKRRDIEKYKVSNAREIAQAKGASKSPKNQKT